MIPVVPPPDKWLTIDFNNDEPLLPLQIDKNNWKLISAITPELDRADKKTENVYELEDLLPMYPDQNIPNIQTYITSKFEFKEKGALLKEPLPKRGEFLKHQEFVHRYLHHYRKLLILHRPGTGKTGAIGGLTEKIKHNLKINETLDFIDTFFSEHRSSIKRAFILVSNPLLQTEFKTQLVYRYSAPGDYDIDNLGTKNEISSKNRIIGKILKGFYKITTYTKFAKLVMTSGFDPEVPLSETPNHVIAKLNELFSDSIIAADEAHNFRIEAPEGENPIKIKKGAQRSKAINYKCIDVVFHLVSRCTKVIMTATPMINYASEIIDLMNLLLPLNNQIPNSKEDRLNFTKMTVNDLEPYFRGKISYVRESGTFVDKKYIGVNIMDPYNPKEVYKYNIGDKIYPSGQLIFPLSMLVNLVDDNNQPAKILDKDGYTTNERLKCQGDVYLGNVDSSYINIMEVQVPEDVLEDEIAAEELKEDIDDSEIDEIVTKARVDIGSNFFKRIGKFRQISDGVFPDGSYGSVGFNKYIIEDKITKEYHGTPELLANISQMDYLQALNVKAAFIIENIKDEMNSPGIHGPIYSYMHLKKGSGAIYLGICLEAHGFEKYTGKESVLKRKVGPITFNPSCTPTAEDQYCSQEQLNKVKEEQELKDTFSKKLRYAILTSGINETDRNNILALYSSPANINGEYLKFLIITPIGREGINLASSMRFYLIDPSWNPSSEFQAESRGLRETSHNEKFKQLEGTGIDKLEIPIYNLAAYVKDERNNTVFSVERDLYTLSEKKDIEIKMKERDCKILSVDQNIHKKRNQKITDIGKEFTGDCDYDICFYDMHDPLPPDDYIDYSTYDIIYSDDVIDKIIHNVKNIFRTDYSLSVNDILDRLVEFRPKLILRALIKIIKDRVKLTNRLGYTCYLLEDQGMLFTQKEYPVTTVNNYQKHYNLNYYSKHLILSDDKRLEDYISDDQLITQSTIIKNMGDTSSNEVIESILQQLSLINIVKLFEDAVINKFITGNTKPIDDYLINKYSKSFSKINEPVKDILNSSLILSTTPAKKPGRKAKTDISFPSMKNPDVSPYRIKHPVSNLEGIPVYVHLLYGDLQNVTGTARTANYNKAEGVIRILRTSDNIWRDTNEAESPVYKQMFINQRVENNAVFNQQGIHGKILADGKFRIVNITPGERHTDRRKNKNGQVCSTMTKAVLMDIMYKLGMPLTEDIGLYVPSSNVGEMKGLLSKTFDVETLNAQQLVYYYKITKSGINNYILCDKIRYLMEARGLIYYG